MMQQLRNFSKAFLIFVVIAFVGSIIFAWGMDIGTSSSERGYIAKINGEEIDPKIYDNVLQNVTNQMNQNGVVYLDWANIVEVRTSAWNQMVYDIVVSQHLEELGLKVSDEELLQYLWHYPPRYIWSEPTLQTDGQFDISKYRTLIADPKFATNLAYIEKQETPQILRMQWAELIRAGIQITPEELMWEFRKGAEKIQIEYAYIPIGTVNDQVSEPDSAAIEAYYNEHKEKYERPPQAELDFIVFNVVPSATDSTNISDLNIWIQQLTEATQDYFTGFAAIVSDDTRARQTGGEVGWIQRGRYTPEFDSIAFSLDSGQISQVPVHTNFGWHILKSVGKRINDAGEEEVHLYQIVKKIRPSGDTFSEFNTQAKQFLDEVKTLGFEEAAAKYGLTISATGLFNQGTKTGRLGVSEEANKFAFSAEDGELSDVIMVANTTQNTFKFVVTKLKQKYPKRILPLNEAYSYARNDLNRERNIEKSYNKALEIIADAGERPVLKEACDKVGSEFYETEFFSRTETSAARLGNDPQIMGAAFGLTMEEPLSQPVYTRNGVAVIMLTGRVFNPAEFDTKKDGIYSALWAQKVRATSEKITQDLIENADIQDFRSTNFKWFF